MHQKSIFFSDLNEGIYFVKGDVSVVCLSVDTVVPDGVI